MKVLSEFKTTASAFLKKYPPRSSLSGAKDLAAVQATSMYYIYILTNQNNKTLYIGVTNDLKRRFYEHKFKKIDGFTQKYIINKLVYFERYKDINSALNREKELKGLLRTKKDLLIQQTNPDWDDLGYRLFPEFYDTGNKEKK